MRMTFMNTDRITKMEKVLAKDKVNTELQKVINKLEGQIEENNQAVSQIEEMIGRLDSLQTVIMDRTERYETMLRQLQKGAF